MMYLHVSSKHARNNFEMGHRHHGRKSHTASDTIIMIIMIMMIVSEAVCDFRVKDLPS